MTSSRWGFLSWQRFQPVGPRDGGVSGQDAATRRVELWK
jgi:hypothetical protein